MGWVSIRNAILKPSFVRLEKSISHKHKLSSLQQHTTKFGTTAAFLPRHTSGMTIAK